MLSWANGKKTKATESHTKLVMISTPKAPHEKVPGLSWVFCGDFRYMKPTKKASKQERCCYVRWFSRARAFPASLHVILSAGALNSGDLARGTSKRTLEAPETSRKKDFKATPSKSFDSLNGCCPYLFCWRRSSCETTQGKVIFH